MTERINSAKIVSQAGLDSSRNFLQLGDLAPGSATMLLNYEPSLYGGYRRINGYQKYGDAVPGEGPILGVAIYGTRVMAARKNAGSNTYSFWSSPTIGSDWVQENTGYTLSSQGVIKIRYTTYNFNGTDKIVFVDGVNPPSIFNGDTWARPAGDQLDPANAGQPKFVCVFKNHIFLSGFSLAPHIVTHSAPLDDLDFNAAPGAGQIVAGFDVLQIKPFRDTLFVFGFNDIKSISVNQTTFVLNDVTTNIGCIASDSIIEIGGDLIFLSQDGFRPISATARIGDIELASVSKQIQSILNIYSKSFSLDLLNSVVVRSKSQVRFFFGSENPDPNLAVGILGALRDNGQGVSWEWSTLKGIKTTCTTSDYIGTNEYIFHGDTDGFVYQQEIGDSFDGRDVQYVYQTPYLDFGDSRIRKTMRTITVFTRPEGPLTLNMAVDYNWGDLFSIDPSGYVTRSQGKVSVYGETVTYGNEFTYGSTTTPVVLTNVQGSCFSTQITISGQDTNPSHSIQGFVFEFSTDGRI